MNTNTIESFKQRRVAQRYTAGNLPDGNSGSSHGDNIEKGSLGPDLSFGQLFEGPVQSASMCCIGDSLRCQSSSRRTSNQIDHPTNALTIKHTQAEPIQRPISSKLCSADVMVEGVSQFIFGLWYFADG